MHCGSWPCYSDVYQKKKRCLSAILLNESENEKRPNNITGICLAKDYCAVLYLDAHEDDPDFILVWWKIQQYCEILLQFKVVNIY